MVRYYKEMSNCKMCGKRFEVKKKSLYWQKVYCPECADKYMDDKKSKTGKRDNKKSKN